jgi:hypothetical protein
VFFRFYEYAKFYFKATRLKRNEIRHLKGQKCKAYPIPIRLKIFVVV